MATLLINLSGGNLHLDNLRLQIPPAGRVEFDCTEDELKAKCPELMGFLRRGRVMLSEDAQLVEAATPENDLQKLIEANTKPSEAVEQPEIIKSE